MTRDNTYFRALLTAVRARCGLAYDEIAARLGMTERALHYKARLVGTRRRATYPEQFALEALLPDGLREHMRRTHGPPDRCDA